MLHQRIIKAMTDRVEHAAQWDADPVLFLIYLQGQLVKLAPLAVPPYAWAGPDGPAAALEQLSLAMARRYPEPPPPGKAGPVHGVAFMYEGWQVSTEEGDHHGERQVSQMIGKRMLYQHPQRREMRALVAVDRDGTTYEAAHFRDSPGTEQRVLFRGETDVQAGGVMVEALDRLVEVLTGAPAQKRPDPTPPQSGEMN